MTQGIQFDAEAARRLSAVYETQDAVRRRRVVLDALALQPGECVIDIGTGPGFLAREMGEQVGRAGRVHGIDASEAMLGEARRRCAAQPWIDFRAADATRLPVADGSFDAAVSVQVFEYVADVDRALREMHRVLRPGGRTVVVATDWDSILWHSRDVARMKRVLAAFEDHCAHPTLPRTLTPKLRAAGFTVERHGLISQFNPVFDPNTYGYHAVDLVRAYVCGRKGVTAQEADAWAQDLRELGALGDGFFCVNQFLFAARKAGGGGQSAV